MEKKIIFVDKIIFMSYFNFLKKEKLFINNLKFSKSMNQYKECCIVCFKDSLARPGT